MSLQLFDNANRTHPRADNLDHVLWLRVTVTRLMSAMKRRRDVAGCLLNLKLERLALVSDCERALMSLLSIRKAFAAQSCARLLFHLAKYLFQCALRLLA